MTSLAILKHVSERNSNYGAALRYLIFEHDAETNKPLLNEQGNMIPREEIIQSGFNCDPFTFDTECTELNRAYRKNLSRKDVKAHHYIISFDPRDAIENELTMQRAHDIGMEFAKKFFAGHQALIVTHNDGHNAAGNIHVHIVLNSLRKENVIWQDFMERPIDAMAGYKHHQTRELLRHMQDYLNTMCIREHLHTVDFSLPTDHKVTDREYKARRRGQHVLDEGNKVMVGAGIKSRITEYETIKQQLRTAIDKAIHEAKSEEELKQVLKEKLGITLKESRGVWSFVHPDRNNPIRARSLGRIYEREAVLNRISGIADIDISHPEYANLPKIFLIHSDLRLVVDIQNCVKAQQSRAYARKVEISNLQQLARSVAYIQKHHIETYDALTKCLEGSENRYNELIAKQQENKKLLEEINETIHYLGQYLSLKKIYEGFLKSTEKKAYQVIHYEQLEMYKAAVSFLKAKYRDDTFPTMASLKVDKAKLLPVPKDTELSILKERIKALQIVKTNVDTMLSPGNNLDSVYGKNLSL